MYRAYHWYSWFLWFCSSTLPWHQRHAPSLRRHLAYMQKRSKYLLSHYTTLYMPQWSCIARATYKKNTAKPLLTYVWWPIKFIKSMWRIIKLHLIWATWCWHNDTHTHTHTQAGEAIGSPHAHHNDTWHFNEKEHCGAGPGALYVVLVCRALMQHVIRVDLWKDIVSRRHEEIIFEIL